MRKLIVVIALHSFVILAHLLTITVIKKAKLHSNRFFLIKMMSLTDIVHALAAALYIIFQELGSSSKMDPALRVSILCLVSSQDMSLYITIMISFDRLIAVKYSLWYPIFVTKRKLKIMLGIIFPYTFLLNFLLMNFSDRIETTDDKVTKGLVFHFCAFSAFTCVTIIVVGALTQRIRNRSEARIHNIQSSHVVHGIVKEQIDILRSLKRSLKDVAVLNYLTVLFLGLRMIIGLLKALGLNFSTNKILFAIVAVNSLSNPFIYAFTQRDISSWIKRHFRRNRINT